MFITMDPIIYVIAFILLSVIIIIFLTSLWNISEDIEKIRISITKNDCVCSCHKEIK